MFCSATVLLQTRWRTLAQLQLHFFSVEQRRAVAAAVAAFHAA